MFPAQGGGHPVCKPPASIEHLAAMAIRNSQPRFLHHVQSVSASDSLSPHIRSPSLHIHSNGQIATTPSPSTIPLHPSVHADKKSSTGVPVISSLFQDRLHDIHGIPFVQFRQRGSTEDQSSQAQTLQLVSSTTPEHLHLL